MLVGITRDGNWYLYHGDTEGLRKDQWFRKELVTPAVLSCNPKDGGFLLFQEGKVKKLPVDGVFPVLHGKWGEDGTVQGLIKLSGIPLIGCGVLASALAMDKHRAHLLAKEAGISVPRGIVLKDREDSGKWEQAVKTLKLPFYVKPVKEGSSFGITRAETYEDCILGIRKAFSFDDQVLVEEEVPGFEVGCGVMGKETLFAGCVDEIQLEGGFFDYEEKYRLITSQIHMPARISPEMTLRVQNTAKKIYALFGMEGFARIDFFCTPQGELVFNEANTIPGFTAHSRFPNMMKGAGISFGEMLNQIIKEALP